MVKVSRTCMQNIVRLSLVGPERLELSRLATPDPKSGASANSATDPRDSQVVPRRGIRTLTGLRPTGPSSQPVFHSSTSALSPIGLFPVVVDKLHVC